MIDWTKSMTQDFEFYKVDPFTWEDLDEIKTIKSCNISRDEDVETLGSATIDTTDILDECYIRVYLIASQNGVTEKVIEKKELSKEFLTFIGYSISVFNF